MPSYKLELELSSACISETEQNNSVENSPVLHSGIVWTEFQLGQLLARRLDSCLWFYISTRQMPGKCFKLEHNRFLSLTFQYITHERLHQWCYKHFKLLGRHKTNHENVNKYFVLIFSFIDKYRIVLNILHLFSLWSFAYGSVYDCFCGKMSC
jgi:hypothetical protein